MSFIEVMSDCFALMKSEDSSNVSFSSIKLLDLSLNGLMQLQI